MLDGGYGEQPEWNGNGNFFRRNSVARKAIDGQVDADEGADQCPGVEYGTVDPDGGVPAGDNVHHQESRAGQEKESQVAPGRSRACNAGIELLHD